MAPARDATTNDEGHAELCSVQKNEVYPSLIRRIGHIISADGESGVPSIRYKLAAIVSIYTMIFVVALSALKLIQGQAVNAISRNPAPVPGDRNRLQSDLAEG